MAKKTRKKLVNRPRATALRLEEGSNQYLDLSLGASNLREYWFSFLSIAVLFLGLGLTTFLVQQQQQTRITATGGPPIAPIKLKLTSTFNSIGIEVPFLGDDNANASTSVQFREITNPPSVWKDALPLWRTVASNGVVISRHGNTSAVAAAQTTNTKLLAQSADILPPTVLITTPTNNQTVSGTVPITFTATDNVAVTNIKLWIGNNVVQTYTTGGTYTYQWDSTTTPNGNPFVIVEAFDAATNRREAAVRVLVANPTVQPTATPVVAATATPTVGPTGVVTNTPVPATPTSIISPTIGGPTATPVATATPTSAPIQSTATPVPASNQTLCTPTTCTGAFYGSILLLNPNKDYEVKVTFTDPDGLGTGVTSNELQGTVRTQNDSLPTASDEWNNAAANLKYYVRANGNDTTGDGKSTATAWASLCKAMKIAPAGAVVQVGSGYYVSPNSPVSGIAGCDKDQIRQSSIKFNAENPAVDDNGNEINSGNRSVISYGDIAHGQITQKSTNPTDPVDPQNKWKPVTITDSQNPATTYTVYKYDSPFTVAYPAVQMGYASTQDVMPQRIASWDNKSGTTTDQSARVWSMMTPQGWVEVLYNNKRYAYGFKTFNNPNGTTSDIYLRMPNDDNPNKYFITITAHKGNGNIGIRLNGPDSRFSGFEVRNIGVVFDRATTNGIIDHNLLVSRGAIVFGKNTVIEKNRFIDTTMFAPTGTELYIPWHFIKDAIILSDGTRSSWSRVGSGSGEGLGAESTAAEANGQQTVIRNNTIIGYFNGIGGGGLTTSTRYDGQDTDIYNNTIKQINDDGLEPEGYVVNWRIWNNRLEQTQSVLSTGPVYLGPIYFFRNQTWKTGGDWNVVDLNGDTTPGLGFKYSAGNLSGDTKARVFVVNNTLWTDSKRSVPGGSNAAGGGSDPERFYLRNNIFRMTRYGFDEPSGIFGVSNSPWDEDFNYFSTTDPIRSMGSGGSSRSPSTRQTVSQYRTVHGQTNSCTNLSDSSQTFATDPDINANVATGVFDLRSGSPLVDAGVAIPNISETYNGNAPDLGAIESSFSNSTNPTASCAQQGPTITSVPTAVPTVAPTVTPTLTPTPSPTLAPTLTITPTPTTAPIGGFPTSTPTPTPVVSQCALIATSAQWIMNTNPVANGTQVGLKVTGSGAACSGKGVAFDIRESDFGIPDTDVTPDPSPATFVFDTASGTWIAQATWNAVWMDDSIDDLINTQPGAGPGPDYFFNANVIGDTTIEQSSNNYLRVSPPSPTPTPIASCSLSSASWASIAKVVQGVPVVLNVTGSGNCVGQTVSFDIREDDGLGVTNPVDANPPSVTFSSSNTASVTWSSEYQQDGFLGINDPPEYFFNATLTSTSQSISSSTAQELQVDKITQPTSLNQTIPSSLITTSSSSSIDIQAPFNGDSNGNASARVEYKKTTDSTWNQGPVLQRTIASKGISKEVAGVVSVVHAQTGTILEVGSAFPYKTISAAIQAAVSGDAIKIHAGTYSELVTVNKQLTLEPYGDGPVWVDGQCTRANGLYITTGASGATVKGFGVRQTNNGAILIQPNTAATGTPSTITIDSMKIEDFDCDNSGTEEQAGIAAWYSGSGMRITNNTITHRVTLAGTQRGQGNGIYFKSSNTDPSGGGHYIAGNIITGGKDGIGGQVEDQVHGSFDKNTTIENNYVTDCLDDGIQVEGGDANVIVKNNRIDTCGIGIALAPNLLGSLYIQNNTIIGDGNKPSWAGNLQCFKVGNNSVGKTYLTDNDCRFINSPAGQASGVAITNPGPGPIEVLRNNLQVTRYVYEYPQRPPLGSNFNENCIWSSDQTRFMKWGTSLNTFSNDDPGFQNFRNTTATQYPGTGGFDTLGVRSQACPVRGSTLPPTPGPVPSVTPTPATPTSIPTVVAATPTPISIPPLPTEKFAATISQLASGVSYDVRIIIDDPDGVAGVTNGKGNNVLSSSVVVSSVSPTVTVVPITPATSVTPTVQPTNTPVPPTATVVPPTATAVPATPTTAPTATSVPATPTVIAQACTVLSSKWTSSNNPVGVGIPVTLSVDVDGDCRGKQLNVRLFEEDTFNILNPFALPIDDPVAVTPAPITLSSTTPTTVTTTWNAEYQDDSDDPTPNAVPPETPEYYFEAQVSGTFSWVRSQAPKLSVNQVTSGPNITSTGSLTLASTYESISVYAPFTDDQNADNKATLEYSDDGKAVTDSTKVWKRGMDMTVDRRADIKDILGNVQISPNPYVNQFRASILGLQPNKNYDVRVTFTDPIDGVFGINPVTASISTRNENFTSSGSTVYVDGSVATTGTGSQINPFKTIQEGITAATAGSTIIIKQGTYTGRIDIHKSGTANNYIWLKAESGLTAAQIKSGTAGRVILDATNNVTSCNNDNHIPGNRCSISVKGSYIRVTGLELIGGDTGIVVISPSTNVIIENNYIHNITFGTRTNTYYDPIFLGDSFGAQNSVKDITVQNNELEAAPGDQAGPVIHMMGTSGGHVIRGNRIIFTHLGQTGLHGSDCIGGSPNKNALYGSLHKDTDVYNNYCEGATDDAVSLDSGAINVRVWNNVITKANVAFSIAPVIGGPAYVFRNLVYNLNDHWISKCNTIKTGEGGTGNVYFYQNTFYIPDVSVCASTKIKGIRKDGSGQPSTNVTFKNNILHVSAEPYDDPQRPTADYNLLFSEQSGASSNPPGTFRLPLFVWGGIGGLNTFSIFQTQTGQEQHGIFGKASFFNANYASGSPDFHLTQGSLGIDSGEVLYGFNDSNSAWSYNGSKPDIGAYEFGGSSNTPTVVPTNTPVPPTVLPTIPGATATSIPPTITSGPTAVPTQPAATITSIPGGNTNCSITAQWISPSSAAMPEGKQVALEAIGSAKGCYGQSVQFAIYEDDGLGIFNQENLPRLAAVPFTYVNGNFVAFAPWITVYKPDVCLGFPLCDTDSEYYFTAQLVGSSTGQAQSQDPELKVTQASGLVFNKAPQANPGNQDATITWQTNASSDSQVQYGVTRLYTHTSPLLDLNPRVQSHIVDLQNLRQCTMYHYAIVSTDAVGNQVTSADNVFRTRCRGTVGVVSESSVSITNALGGVASLTDANNLGVTITVPTQFANNDADFQVKQLDPTSFASVVPPPSGFGEVGSYLYHFNALSDVSTEIANFNKNLTVSMSYSSSALAGFDETTLKIYRNDGVSWNELPNCIVDSAAKVITCQTSAFSDFMLVGQPVAAPTPTPTTIQSAPIPTSAPAQSTSGGPASAGSSGGGGGGGGPASAGSGGGGGAPATGQGRGPDLNSDGRVNIFDLSILLRGWNRGGLGDLNSDGRVNIFDLSILLRGWR